MRSPITHHDTPLDTLPEHPLSEALATPETPSAPAVRWQSSQLLGSAREVAIEHSGHVYRLRLTALGKLILTK